GDARVRPPRGSDPRDGRSLDPTPRPAEPAKRHRTVACGAVRRPSGLAVPRAGTATAGGLSYGSQAGFAAARYRARIPGRARIACHRRAPHREVSRDARARVQESVVVPADG